MRNQLRRRDGGGTYLIAWEDGLIEKTEALVDYDFERDNAALLKVEGNVILRWLDGKWAEVPTRNNQLAVGD
jgi:hypothetical protein